MNQFLFVFRIDYTFIITFAYCKSKSDVLLLPTSPGRSINNLKKKITGKTHLKKNKFYF